MILAGALEIHTIEARHAAGVRYLRQVLQNADVRPWIRRPNEVIYNENRSRTPIDFANQAFDGFATADEVLALVGPILGLAPAQRTNGGSPSPAAPNSGNVTQEDCPPGTTPEALPAGFICRPQ
ncbi:MAG: hypothetical protein HC895_21125 [Leptolyngbyaceae cyanobacterium SM1_3_5]|nr:hypothetical protein [Leptolyngbyaceae cyanobacterium SM1_3_5]